MLKRFPQIFLRTTQLVQMYYFAIVKTNEEKKTVILRIFNTYTNAERQQLIDTTYSIFLILKILSLEQKLSYRYLTFTTRMEIMCKMFDSFAVFGTFSKNLNSFTSIVLTFLAFPVNFFQIVPVHKEICISFSLYYYYY